jgi:hypothetical protein
MDILRELLRVVTSKSDAAGIFPELTSESEPDTVTGKFIRGVIENRFSTDDDAALSLYGASRMDQRYRTLKSRVQERALQAMLHLQVKQPEHSEYLSYYYRCTRNLIAAQTLMRFASRAAGTFVAERTLTIAKKYHFTDLCLPLVALLRDSAAIRMEKRSFDKYNVELKRYLEVLRAEYESNELIDNLLLITFLYRTKDVSNVDYDRAIATVSAAAEKYQSHILILNKYRLELMHSQWIREYELVINTCDAALEYLKANPHLQQKARVGEFSLEKMGSSIVLRRFDHALAIANTCVDSFREAGNNWYLALDLSFVAAMNNREYGRAEMYLATATQHKRFGLQPELIHERWSLYGAYYQLAIELGLASPGQKKKQQFRLSTFLNSLPEFSKEKRLLNTTILIAHVAFLICNGDFDLAERRIDYLKVYATRYMKEPEVQRIRVFMGLLFTFPKHSFDHHKLRSANASLVAQLESTQAERMTDEVSELIPFELLYERLLMVLERDQVEAA